MKKFIGISFLLVLMTLFCFTGENGGGNGDITDKPCTLVSTGEDEREYSPGVGCYSDVYFTVGIITAGNVRIGGDTEFCDSEFGMSMVFDLSVIPVGYRVTSASLVLRQVNYNVTPPQIGLFYYPYDYSYAGATFEVHRDTMTAAAAFRVITPPTVAGQNVSFDVADAVQDIIDDIHSSMAFFIAPVPSAVGNNNRMVVEGSDGTMKPSLIVSASKE